MPKCEGWKTTKKAPHPPIAILTIAFFAVDLDSMSANIIWGGFGKYLNYAFRCKLNSFVKILLMPILIMFLHFFLQILQYVALCSF